MIIGLAGTLSLLLVALQAAFASTWGYFAFIDRADVASTIP